MADGDKTNNKETKDPEMMVLVLTSAAAMHEWYSRLCRAEGKVPADFETYLNAKPLEGLTADKVRLAEKEEALFTINMSDAAKRAMAEVVNCNNRVVFMKTCRGLKFKGDQLVLVGRQFESHTLN